jgi:hypothetical protein
MAQTERKKSKNKKQDSDLPVPLFNALIKPDDKNNRADINKQEDHKLIQILPIPEQVVAVKESNYSRGNFWLQLVLVACSIAMLYTVYKLSSAQNEITNNTLKFQIQKTFSDSISQHIKDSLAFKKTDSSLGLTSQSIELAQRNFRIENRPWLGIKYILIDTFEIYKRPSFNVFFKNYGKTPAINARFVGYVEGHSIQTYNGFDFVHDKNGLNHSSVLSPGDTAYVHVWGDYVLNEIASFNLKRKNFYMYVFGIVTYSDVFNGRDTTTFSYFMKIDTVTGTGTFTQCPYGNRMK